MRNYNIQNAHEEITGHHFGGELCKKGISFLQQHDFIFMAVCFLLAPICLISALLVAGYGIILPVCALLGVV